MISHSNRVVSFSIDGMAVVRGGVRCSGIIYWQVITEREMEIICGRIGEHICSKLSINTSSLAAQTLLRQFIVIY
jgi:hypothetical protein